MPKPDPMEEQNILSSLVDLTKQRDQLALKARLLATLMDITDAAWIVMCRLLDHQDGGDVKILDRLPNDAEGRTLELYPQGVFEHPELFHRCLAQGHPLWVKDLEHYQAMLFPLPDEGREEDFVVVFSERIEGRLERIVGSVLDLYGNFMRLVIENTQDALTRLRNRQTFDQDLLRSLLLLQKERRHDGQTRHCYLAMLDIDRFKRINDTYGHLYGDEVLLLFSSLMRDTFREDDHLYRYGGEEFAAILCGTDEEGVRIGLERFRARVEAYEFPQVGGVTVSIGFAEMKGHTMPSTVVENADLALYYSKEHGRNRVSLYERLLAEGELESRRGQGSVDLF